MSIKPRASLIFFILCSVCCLRSIASTLANKTEISSRYNRAHSLQPPSSILMKQGKSGYEPSDTETDWLESPSRDHTANNGVLDYDYNQGTKLQSDLPRNYRTWSPIRPNRRHVSKLENSNGSASSALSQARGRNNSISPFKHRMEGGTYLSPTCRSNISPYTKPERRRHVPSNKPVGRLEHDRGDDKVNDDKFVTGNQSLKTRSKDEKEVNSQFPEVIRETEKLIYIRRSMRAPRTRARDHMEQENNHVVAEQRERKPSPLSMNITWKQREAASQRKTPTVGEINEMVAGMKISRSPPSNALKLESTDSIGDIFFSRDVFAKNGGIRGDLVYPRPVIFSQQGDSSSHHQNRSNSSSTDQNPQRPARAIPMTANFVVGRQSNDRFSSESSKISYASGKSSKSAKKFVANRRKSQSDAWFSCVRNGYCRNSKSSPERRAFVEASFIEKALVVEKLRHFWADKHQPSSLNGFLCHKHEAQLLKELVSDENFAHILFKGPPGSGKRSLAVALLREIYGDPCWNISHDLRYFPVQDKMPMQVLVPLTSSAHHVELNLKLEVNAKYALMGLVKEIKDDYALTPEVSNGNIKTDYKVIVLYEVDQSAENIQHLIKWIMDGYTDTCKLILCCEDDVDILESVKNRCKVIKVDAPVPHEIMEVLIQIAKKEDFDISMSFAAKIATKSKQNLRKAIMALEACKETNYPFAEDQPIPVGWEDVLIELSAEILADPSPKRLFVFRGKIQKLLLDFVHPKLILLKLVEQFLKGVQPSLKREIYYWHAHYDKRLPTGTSALLKLEEFVAKFMSIYRKSSDNRQFV